MNDDQGTVEPARATSPYMGGGAPALGPIVSSSNMSYRPLFQLGEGGMARVFLARAVGAGGFKKLVVLKVMRKDEAEDDTIRQMFLEEARLCARLNHPNLVQVYEVSASADQPCLIMEYLDGKPLSAMSPGEHITRPMLLAVISESLTGLHHAHELASFDGKPLNIVHRDVSPQNVFVTYDGAVKVLDFGIAKADGAGVETETGEIKGKLTYMAPEQLLATTVDRRADLFAVGCILWEIAVGARMWENTSESQLMRCLAEGRIPRPSEKAAIDPALEAIIVKATAANPDDRHSTALELQCDIDAYLRQGSGRPSMREIGLALGETFKEDRDENQYAIRDALQSLPPEERVDEVEPPAPRRAALIAALALLVAGAAAWGIFRRGSPPTAAASSAESLVTINVRASPPGARIEIDGKDLGAEDIALRVAADGSEHMARIMAAGYATETRVLKYDTARKVDVVLEKTPDAESSAPPARAPLPSARPVASPRAPGPAARKPPPEAPPAEAPPAEAPADKCSPPFYFVQGIKTYKPDCL